MLLRQASFRLTIPKNSQQSEAIEDMMVSKALVNVAITSDLMCPWCYVGLKKLQQASKETNIDTNVTWKPFLLRPNIPSEGQPKGGTPQSRVGLQLKHAGHSVGIDFTGLTDRTPNTVLFHATMAMLQENESVSTKSVTAFHEAVFEAYFTLGVFPDQDGILKATQNMTTDDKEKVYKAIEELYQDSSRLREYSEQVKYEAWQESARGVSGVPCFEFNGEPAFSGAQPVSTFAKYLNAAAAETSEKVAKR